MKDQWLEIFRAGEYPQGKFTISDLDEIADGYSPTIFEAPVTKDHEQTGPAHGWVSEVKRDGISLFARIKQASIDLASWVKNGAYKKRSIELYNDFQGTGKKYLKALSFLGATAEQVKGMKQVEFGEANGSFELFTDFNPQLRDNIVPVQEKKQMSDDKGMSTFTDQQVRTMVDTAVASATAQMSEQLRVEREGRERLEERSRRDDIKHFCDTLLSAGKGVAAWREAGVENFIYTLDTLIGNTILKFGEADKTPGTWFREFLKKFTIGAPVKDVKGEWIPSDAGKTPKDLLDERIAAFSEKNPAVGYVDALIAVTRQDSLLGENYLDTMRG